MFRVYSIIIGYLFGCVQAAYIVGRANNVNLKEKGSGNLGTTNAFRVMGKKAGIVIFAIDIIKALIAYKLCVWIFPGNDILPGIYAGFGVVLGHDFPFYLKFNGGKGIASTIGMILAVFGWPTVISVAAGIIGLSTLYVSLGSLFFCTSIPIAFYFLGYSAEIVAITSFMAVIAIIRHKSNIKRLLNHSESKINLNNIFKKKTEDG